MAISPPPVHLQKRHTRLFRIQHSEIVSTSKNHLHPPFSALPISRKRSFYSLRLRTGLFEKCSQRVQGVQFAALVYDPAAPAQSYVGFAFRTDYKTQLVVQTVEKAVAPENITVYANPYQMF